MPGGPPWMSTTITLDDAPNEPQTLLYRDPVACAEFLFQNPEFSECMDFEPKHVFEADGTTRVYHEMCTGDEYHRQQVRVRAK